MGGLCSGHDALNGNAGEAISAYDQYRDCVEVVDGSHVILDVVGDATPLTPATPSDVVKLAVVLMTGDVIAELELSKTTCIGQVKHEVAKRDKKSSSSYRLAFFLEEKELRDGVALQELCSSESLKIMLQLIRVGSHTFSRVALPNVNFNKSDYVFKFLFIGDSGVGKSVLLEHTAANIPFEECLIATIGVDFKIVNVAVDERHLVKAQMWDTSGISRFQNICVTYYRGCHGAMIVFDITDRESFVNLSKWCNEWKERAPKNAIFCFVGTKSDLGRLRQVTEAEAAEFAAARGTLYFEVSCKSGSNVAAPLYYLIGQRYDHLQQLGY